MASKGRRFPEGLAAKFADMLFVLVVGAQEGHIDSPPLLHLLHDVHSLSVPLFEDIDQRSGLDFI